MKIKSENITNLPNKHSAVRSNFFQKQKEVTPFFQKTTRPSIQPKLTVGQPGDPYEQEANAMAEKVVGYTPSEPTGQMNQKVQRKCAACEEEELQMKEGENRPEMQCKPIFESETDHGALQMKCAACEEEEKTLQPKSASDAGRTGGDMSHIESSLSSSKGSGSPLPDNTRSQMEGAFGADFSEVRVHTDSSAVQMNQSLQAQAFTHGSDVYFNSGKYDTEGKEGKRLLGHELTHVVQQGGSNIVQKQLSLPIIQLVKEHGDLAQVPPDIGTCQIATTSSTNEQEVPYTRDSHSLNPSTQLILNDFVHQWRLQGANKNVRIDGYASVEGVEPHNWQLSCSRAITVKNGLQSPTNGEQGIPENFISVYAHGETNRFSQTQYFPNRIATITSSIPINPNPQPQPQPQPQPTPLSPQNICGPDITSSLNTLLPSIDAYFHGLGSWWEKRRSCMVLDIDSILSGVSPIMAWDTRQLFLPNTSFLDSYFNSHGCGSPRDPGCPMDSTRSLCETDGTCGNSVVVGGKCMLAGTANYAIYGRMFKLCNDEFSPDYPRWDMRAMINMYKALSFDDPEPPREMASSVFDGTFPTVPTSTENRGFCTGRCGQTHSGSFSFVWEPYRPR